MIRSWGFRGWKLMVFNNRPSSHWPRGFMETDWLSEHILNSWKVTLIALVKINDIPKILYIYNNKYIKPLNSPRRKRHRPPRPGPPSGPRSRIPTPTPKSPQRQRLQRLRLPTPKLPLPILALHRWNPEMRHRSAQDHARAEDDEDISMADGGFVAWR